MDRLRRRVYVQRGYLLRNVPGSRYKSHTEPGLFEETVQRKGRQQRQLIHTCIHISGLWYATG